MLREAVARLRDGRWLLAAIALAVLAGAVAIAGRIAAGQAAGELRDGALAALPLAAGTLTGEIEKQRLVPLVLARDDAVRDALRRAGKVEETALDAKLKAIAGDALASAIYVIDTAGIAISASNAGQPDSFVGIDYNFRHYFTDAMAKGAASQYGLGTISGKPGLYLAGRVDDAGKPLGVAVLKVELGGVEANWRASGFRVFVTDERGVVLATSQPDWRFHALAPLSAADAAAAHAQLQLDAAFEPLPIRRGAGDGLATIEEAGKSRRFVEVVQDLPGAVPGWRLWLLTPADAALTAAANTARLTTLLGLLLTGLLAYVLTRRRRTSRLRQEALARMNIELESRVSTRTAELTRSNTALAGEIAERENAEAKVRRLRDDLAQANRLSILGQIAAGVAHEINQPVAAIRTYAENAGRFLDAGKTEPASGNLTSIVSMTERIGAITSTLRSFARRPGVAASPLPVREAIEGALSLLSGRIRDSGVTIVKPHGTASPLVMASRIRLEQILVNLLQNALDAMKDRPDPRIEIDLAERDDRVLISVRDNGPGLGPEAAGNLFMPFQTTKEKGLGLGLVISQEIAQELGGTLRLDPDTAGGASFTIDLRRIE
ncbi:sensor histidine kinase [Mesorhizobium sp. M00.F.Ca.ET.151.01.1.1]|uniref:sensor histidine kinase n=2 Tax=Mesorhizobium TaxID=68287 RepID=UPI000FD84892|nr:MULTISPECIES: sensor histidine kinase [unclassified Mesorhizobium]RWC76611.1 MAG: sensor histidine kinase [Mesorhizobium sp.]TGR44415.1 sensor histidine kinase [bacterium M00.F.Ca.ET.199.01.1.1]TGU33279.1 sensor histidine kinase [bacterium M00.F.Ca.ET.156.01.1.1]TGU94486.1 sensor histidine kinase [Mesorhizobium sp. M00.F.Ca.ET.151.01.1.1]TGV87484.1 sensor histidine kinase [Mesorhizobium sp. M00.F.Ca.ET.149.01.1.1]